MDMEKFLISELIEELRNDPSWCDNEEKRNTLINALINMLMTT
jgi:hypothetical protein